MLPVEKIVTDAIVACLAQGLTDQLAANAELYGTVPFQIDFSAGSPSFATCYVDPENIEESPLTEFPAACVYVEDWAESGDTYALGFSGHLIACADFYIRYRDGIEANDTESQLNAISDAVRTLYRANIWPIVQNVSTVAYSRRAKGTRRHFLPLGDGWGAHISIQAQFGVSIN